MGGQYQLGEVISRWQQLKRTSSQTDERLGIICLAATLCLRGTAAADDTQIRCSLWSAADDAQVLEAAEALAGAAPAEDLLVGGALGVDRVQRLLADGLQHGVEDGGDRCGSGEEKPECSIYR